MTTEERIDRVQKWLHRTRLDKWKFQKVLKWERTKETEALFSIPKDPRKCRNSSLFGALVDSPCKILNVKEWGERHPQQPEYDWDAYAVKVLLPNGRKFWIDCGPLLLRVYGPFTFELYSWSEPMIRQLLSYMNEMIPVWETEDRYVEKEFFKREKLKALEEAAWKAREYRENEELD